MKPLFLAFLIAFLSCSAALAQSPETPPATVAASAGKIYRNFGVKGGANIAMVSNLQNSDVLMGFHAGVFGNVEISEGFGLGAELNYSKQGVSLPTQDVTLNYLSIPVMMNLLDGPVNLQLGLYGGQLLNAHSRAGEEKRDVSSYFQNADFGFVFGLNFFPAGPTFISARFNLGVTDINNRFTKPADAVLENRNIQVSGGYKF